MSLLQLAGVALFLSLFLILLSNQWNKNDTLQSTPRSLLQLTSLSSSKLRLPAFEGPQGQGNYGYMFEDSQIYQHSKYVVNARGPGDVAAASDRLLASTSGLSTTSMIQSFQEAKARLEEKLRRDYGADYFDGIFRPKLDGKPMNVGRYLYVSQPETELSWQRMKRRMIKKILQVQVGGQELAYVWATGGHSAAAAHGDLLSESYTQVLEDNAKEVFASVGLQLQGRNYAMGGTRSGMEVGACLKEVFGLDIDVLSWDFGMTDGRNMKLLSYYFYRAALLPSRPAGFAIEVGKSAQRIGVMKTMEENGMTMFYKDDNRMSVVYEAIPSMLGLSSGQIDAMPKFIQYFKCDGLEKGSPGCGDNKWTVTDSEICNNRKFKTSWHPGWRWHAIQGNILALFLVEVIDEALKEISSRGSDPTSLLKEMQDLEDADYTKFRQADLSHLFKGLIPEDAKDVDLATLLNYPNYGHTARLPAEIRYLGILTESDQKGIKNYDKGTPSLQVSKTQNENGLMRLSYELSERQACPIDLQLDYADFYLITGDHDGWSKITVPNKAERDYYGTGAPIKGLVASCLSACSWGRCPKGMVNVPEFREGKSSMTVNGVEVTNVTEFEDCFFFKGEHGHIWPPNSDGAYEIAVNVHESGSFMKFSAFLVW